MVIKGAVVLFVVLWTKRVWDISSSSQEIVLTRGTKDISLHEIIAHPFKGHSHVTLRNFKCFI